MNLANARAQFGLDASRIVHGAAQLTGAFCSYNEIAQFTFRPSKEPQPPRTVPANPIDWDIQRRFASTAA